MNRNGFRHCELCPFILVSEKTNKGRIAEV